MSDYLYRMSMSKNDSFEKFYVVCQKKRKHKVLGVGCLANKLMKIFK